MENFRPKHGYYRVATSNASIQQKEAFDVRFIYDLIWELEILGGDTKKIINNIKTSKPWTEFCKDSDIKYRDRINDIRESIMQNPETFDPDHHWHFFSKEEIENMSQSLM